MKGAAFHTKTIKILRKKKNGLRIIIIWLRKLSFNFKIQPKVTSKFKNLSQHK